MKAYGMKRAKHPDGSRYFKLKEQDVTDQELQQLETYADRLFASLGIDVAFSKHFRDRLNDPRNNKPITMAELTKTAKRLNTIMYLKLYSGLFIRKLKLYFNK